MAEAIDTTQQIVLSVRMRGDEQGPQTGDVVLGGNIFGDFNEKEYYDKNEAVIYNGAIYRSKDDVEPGEWDPNEWQCLTDIIMRIADYQPGYAYVKGETIQVDGHLYRAPNDFISGNDFDPSEWEAIDSVNTILWNFEAGANYSQYEIIAHEGKLYRAVNQFTAGDNFVESDWEKIGDIIVNNFQPNTNYAEGNIIVVGGKLYRANQDFTSGNVFQPEYWDAVNSSGVGGFQPNTYYSEGSMIYVDEKLYVAKQDFTSVSAFDPGDWNVASETKAETYLNNHTYQQHEIVYYNGAVYRAKAAFVSGSTWDPADWEILGSSTTDTFQPNTDYLKGTIIFQDGILWIAKRDFTSGATFDPTDWDPLTQTEQETYDSWLATGTTVNVDSMREKFQNDSNNDIHILNAIDSNNAYVEVTNTNAAARLKSDSGVASLTLSDDDSSTVINDEKMTITKGSSYFDVDLDTKTVTMSSDIANSLGSNIATMSTTQKGVAKSDGVSTRVNSGVLTSYPVPDLFDSGKEYKKYELCTFGDQVYAAKATFTSSSWDISKWFPIKRTVGTYTANQAYSVGDLISITNSTHNDLYMCISEISSAPASMVAADWYKLEMNGTQVYLDAYGHKVLSATNLQSAYDALDTQEYTNVRPLDDTTRYRVTVQAAGSTPPSATTGVTKICFYTE